MHWMIDHAQFWLRDIFEEIELIHLAIFDNIDILFKYLSFWEVDKTAIYFLFSNALQLCYTLLLYPEVGKWSHGILLATNIVSLMTRGSQMGEQQQLRVLPKVEWFDTT